MEEEFFIRNTVVNVSSLAGPSQAPIFNAGELYGNPLDPDLFNAPNGNALIWDLPQNFWTYGSGGGGGSGATGGTITADNLIVVDNATVGGLTTTNELNIVSDATLNGFPLAVVKPQIYVVSMTGTAYSSVSAAVAQAQADGRTAGNPGIVKICAGVYNETSGFTLTSGISLVGESKSQTVINLQQPIALVRNSMLADGTSIENLTLSSTLGNSIITISAGFPTAPVILRMDNCILSKILSPTTYILDALNAVLYVNNCTFGQPVPTGPATVIPNYCINLQTGAFSITKNEFNSASKVLRLGSGILDIPIIPNQFSYNFCSITELEMFETDNTSDLTKIMIAHNNFHWISVDPLVGKGMFLLNGGDINLCNNIIFGKGYFQAGRAAWITGATGAPFLTQRTIGPGRGNGSVGLPNTGINLSNNSIPNQDVGRPVPVFDANDESVRIVDMTDMYRVVTADQNPCMEYSSATGLPGRMFPSQAGTDQYILLTGTPGETYYLPPATLSQYSSYHLVNSSAGSLTISPTGTDVLIGSSALLSGISAVFKNAHCQSGVCGNTVKDWVRF
jgi:hypothetical protein